MFFRGVASGKPPDNSRKNSDKGAEPESGTPAVIGDEHVSSGGVNPLPAPTPAKMSPLTKPRSC